MAEFAYLIQHQSTPILDAGTTISSSGQYLDSMALTPESLAHTKHEKMLSKNASKSPEKREWYSLLSNTVVGVQVLKILMDTRNTERLATAKTAKVDLLQTMYTK